jgi:DNA-binding transcriptional LysR family regulator
MPLASPWELPDLISLRLLVEIVDHQSIGAGARQLGISQPSASERLARLERRLGIQLCTRGPRGVHPTPAGELVRDWAAEVLEHLDRLVDGVATLRSDRIADVRIAASLTVADYLVPGWVHALRRAMPEASIHLEVANSGEVVRAVTAGEADLGFVEGGSLLPRLASKVIAHDELVVVVTPEHPWARRSPPTISAAELAHTPLIAREPGSGTRDVLERALRAANRRELSPPPPGSPPFRVAFEAGSTGAIKAAVLAGDGPAVVSVLAISEEVARGELVVVHVESLRLARRLRAIWRESKPPAGAGAALLRIASSARLHA